MGEGGNNGVVLKGEIYNHRELRAELESHGEKFKTSSDTEVVLRAFLRWDKDCFARLRGMFALAIWSQDARRLVLARDRLGIKPLYFHLRGGELYFGSELKTIFAHPEFKRELDFTRLQYYLSLNYLPSPHTLARRHEKLPPGHLFELQEAEREK